MGFTLLIIDDSKSVRQKILTTLRDADLFTEYF